MKHRKFFIVTLAILIVGVPIFAVLLVASPILLMQVVGWFNAPSGRDYVFRVSVDLTVEGERITMSRKVRCSAEYYGEVATPHVRRERSIKAFGAVLKSGHGVFIEVPYVCPQDDDKLFPFPKDFIPLVGWTDDPNQFESFELHISNSLLREGRGRIHIHNFVVEELSRFSFTDNIDAFNSFGSFRAERMMKYRTKTDTGEILPFSHLSYLRGYFYLLGWHYQTRRSREKLRGIYEYGTYLVIPINRERWELLPKLVNLISNLEGLHLVGAGPWTRVLVDTFSQDGATPNYSKRPFSRIKEYIGRKATWNSLRNVVPLRKIGAIWRPDFQNRGILVFIRSQSPVSNHRAPVFEFGGMTVKWPENRLGEVAYDTNAAPILIYQQQTKQLYQVSWVGFNPFHSKR